MHPAHKRMKEILHEIERDYQIALKNCVQEEPTSLASHRLFAEGQALNKVLCRFQEVDWDKTFNED